MIASLGTYVRKIVSRSSSSKLRVARPMWPIYGRPIRPAGSQRLIRLVRMERSALRARPSLRKADRLYCSIWPTRWKSRMVPRGNEFNDFEIGRNQIGIGRPSPFVKSSFSVIYVSRGWRWWDVATLSFSYRKCGNDRYSRCWPMISGFWS